MPTPRDSFGEHRIEPELLGPAPRRVRLRLGYRQSEFLGAGCALLFLLPLCLAALVLVSVAIRDTLPFASGVRTTGIVIHRSAETGDDGNLEFNVTVRYHAGNSTYETDEAVTDTLYYSVREGSSLPVRYLPSSPGQSEVIADGNSWTQMLITWLVAIGVSALFAIPMLWLIRILRTHRRLVTHGTPITGVITDAGETFDTDSETGRRRRIFWLKYQFTPPDGMAEGSGFAPAPIEGRMNVSCEQWSSVSEGSRVTALYLPERRQENTLYPFQMFEAIPRPKKPAE